MTALLMVSLALLLSGCVSGLNNSEVIGLVKECENAGLKARAFYLDSGQIYQIQCAPKDGK